MAGSGPEVADVFRRYGDAYREQHDGSLSTAQRRVMTAIEICRTAAIGGHVEQCDTCGHQRISYNSCIMGKFRNGESTACAASSPEQFEAPAQEFAAWLVSIIPVLTPCSSWAIDGQSQVGTQNAGDIFFRAKDAWAPAEGAKWTVHGRFRRLAQTGWL